MPIVSVGVTVQVELPGDPGAIQRLEVENAVRAEGEWVARELYGEVLGQIEAVALAQEAVPPASAGRRVG